MNTKREFCKRLALVFIATMLQCGHATGQISFPKVSSIDEYSNETGSSAMIKTLGNYTVVYNKDYGLPYSHTFFVYKLGVLGITTLSVKFSTDFGSSESQYDYTCVVNDMELMGDTCYLCGRMTIDNGAPILDPNNNVIVPRFKSYGFIGKFALMPANNSYTIKFQQIDSTSNLTRIAVSHCNDNSISVVITAVGDSDNLPSPTCLVDIRYLSYGNLGYKWIYSIGYPSDHNYADVEHFEDVLALDDTVIIVSRRECADVSGDGLACYSDRHFEFLVYKSVPGGFAWDADTIYLHKTYNGTGTNDPRTWHSGSEQMRLCKFKNNGFCLAYSIRYHPDSSTDIKYHSVYAFKYISLIDSSVMFSCAGNHHVKEISFNSHTDNLNMLCVDNLNPNGIIYRLSQNWEWPDCSILSLKKQNHTIDFINNNQNVSALDFVGYNTSHTLCRYKQEETEYALNLTSCFTKETISYHYNPCWEHSFIMNIDVKMGGGNDNNLLWESCTASCTAIQPMVNDCSTYYTNN